MSAQITRPKSSERLNSRVVDVDAAATWNVGKWYVEFQAVGGYVTPKGIGWFVRDHEVSYLRSTATSLIEELEADPRRYLELRFYLDLCKVQS